MSAVELFASLVIGLLQKLFFLELFVSLGQLSGGQFEVNTCQTKTEKEIVRLFGMPF